MPRKPLTEEQKAVTPLYENLMAHPQTPKSLQTVVEAIMLYHKMDERTTVCALRDYFQVRVARKMDESLAETQARIKKLESKLGEKR